MKSLLLIIFSLCIGFNANLIAQPHADHDHSHHASVERSPDNLTFIKNIAQWHSNIKYRANLGGLDKVFLEEQAFTFLFHGPKETQELHNIAHKTIEERKKHMVPGHAYKVKFLDANLPTLKANQQKIEYHNYFLGNDQSKWSSKVPLFEQVVYDEIYNGIDLLAYSQEGLFKYDFIVDPGSDPCQIKLEYQGLDKILVKDGHLYLTTSIGTINEFKPYTYQFIDGKEQPVDCDYHLDGQVVSYTIGNYDSTIPLIIDPVVVGATLTGTSALAWGNTATYDNIGNIYAGGICFATGYPTTTGSFQTSFAGGQTDIVFNKYNPDASQLIYATYIGGNFEERPHSSIVDFNGQLCIFGSSLSTDYPVTSNAVQQTNNGQADIVITKLNADGTALVGSTYLGGSQSDGLNNSTLNSNYDDHYRGEIVLDEQGNIFVVSNSSSSDFPVTTNAFQTNHNETGFPDQDAVVLKLNSDLSTLFWATYIGGDDADIGLGLRVNSSGEVYVTGAAGASTFPMTTGGYLPTWPGGQETGFVVLLSSDGQQMLSSTFFGSSDGDEHSFFIDIDENDIVHIYGQTTGTIDVTPNTYFSNEGSRQFLAAFTPNLEELVYSTVIGTGTSFNYDFVPVAFMVDKCNGIYFSGYESVNGLPTTPDAISSSASGQGAFYLGQLEPYATSLNFGTYYGEAYHVDGGTSRFDKSGTVYQGVCSCTNGIMNTTPNAWSTTQNSSIFCDIGVFKIDFEIETVIAAAFASPATSGCAPFSVDFQYTGSDADTYFWDFGTGGATSIEENPSYTFENAGTYTVMQIVNAPNTCNLTDTFFLQIDVLDNSTTSTDTTFCAGLVDLFLDVSVANAVYDWQDGSTGATYQVNIPGIYWVDVAIAGCTRRDSFVVSSSSPILIDLGQDDSFCDVPSFTLDATNSLANSYLWTTGGTGPMLTVNESGVYAVTITDAEGCTSSDDIELIFGITPIIELGSDTILCEGEVVTLIADFPDATYEWQDGSTSPTYLVETEGTYTVTVDNNGCTTTDVVAVEYSLNPGVNFNVVDAFCNGDENGSIESIVAAGNGDIGFLWSNGSTDLDLYNLPAGNYPVTITNDFGCEFETAAIVEEPGVLEFDPTFSNVECHGDADGWISINDVFGGVSPFMFSFNGDTLSPDNVLNNLSGGDYDVLISDANGCTYSETIIIYEPPEILLSAGPDQTILLGDSVMINGAISTMLNQEIEWTMIDSLYCNGCSHISCYNCLRPWAGPFYRTEYVLTSVDTITGCTYRDTMIIQVDKPRNVYIPNVFSPNGDGPNDIFYIFADQRIAQVNYFRIYDRWGELVHAASNFLPNDPTFGWDGRLKGKDMNPGVFAFIAEVVFIDGFVQTFKGDVTLLR